MLIRRTSESTHQNIAAPTNNNTSDMDLIVSNILPNPLYRYIRCDKEKLFGGTPGSLPLNGPF